MRAPPAPAGTMDRDLLNAHSAESTLARMRRSREPNAPITHQSYYVHLGSRSGHHCDGGNMLSITQRIPWELEGQTRGYIPSNRFTRPEGSIKVVFIK